MLVFTALIMCRWMGWASPDLSETLALKLLGIVQLGMGGYIASRGGGEGDEEHSLLNHSPPDGLSIETNL